MNSLKLSRQDGLLLLVVLIWGANFGLMKAALREIEPVVFSSLCLLLGAPAMLLVLFSYEKQLLLEGGRLAKNRGDLAVFGVLAFLLAGNYLVFTWGLTHTTSVNASIISAACPIVVAILSFFKGRPVSRLGLTGLGIASAGVLMVIGAPQGLTVSAFTASSTLKGDVLIFIAVVSWALYTNLSALVLDRYSSVRVSAYAVTGAAILALLASFPSIASQTWASISWMAWAGLLYAAGLNLVVALVIWLYAIAQMGPLKVITYQYLVPVIAFILAVALWKETVYPAQVLGCILVLAGVRFVRIS